MVVSVTAKVKIDMSCGEMNPAAEIADVCPITRRESTRQGLTKSMGITISARWR